MPRPRKRRILSSTPSRSIYKPAGVPLDSLGRVQLLHEELEAMRLADLEGLTQAEGAAQMGVSRSTFQRMVTRARRQTAMALAQRQALEIEGGTFQVSTSRHRRQPNRHPGRPARDP